MRDGLGDLPHGFQAVQRGHGNVDDHGIGLELGGLVHGLAAVYSFGDNFPSLLLFE
jgi:hypothetical protein